jgi:signal transduction histidine kinase
MTVNDASRAILEGAFAHPAFVASRRRGAAAILLAGAPLRILWANAAAGAVFEAQGYDDLGARLLRSDRGSARRLEQLAAALVPGAAPRLERLRFMWAFSPHSVTVLCARPHGFDETPALVLAAASPGHAEEPWHEEVGGTPAPSATARRPAPIGSAGPSVDEDEIERARQRLAAAGGTDQVRFVWRTDAAGVVSEIDQARLERLGLGWRPQGLALASSAARFDPAGAEALDRAMARRTTFTGLDLDAPLTDQASAGHGLRVPIGLGGSPVFESGGRFAGYRGFGRLDLQRLHAAPEPIDPPAPSASDAAAGEVDDTVAATEAVAGVDPSRPDGLASGPRPKPPIEPATAQADAEPAPSPETAEPPVRAANVVHLRPLGHAGRASVQRQEGAGGHTDADGPDAARGLSDSEQVNFQEIGRTLSAAIGAISPADAAAPPGRPSSSEGSPRSDDPMARAALLVETMATGLLVVRHPRVLFANDALLAELRYDSHRALADALGLFFAGTPPLAAAESVAMRLPGAVDAGMDFVATGRAIDWDGETAILWTLRPAEAASPRQADPAPNDAGLRAMLDAVADAVACIDGSGRVLMMNRRAAAWFGPDERSDGDLAALLAPESRTGFTARLAELGGASGDDVRSRADHVARTPNGGMAPIGLTLTRLGPERFAAVWHDLSAEREVEWEMSRLKSQTERVNGQQPEFLAKISHEIRTPLNAILGFAEIMIDERFGPLGNIRYKDYLQDIHASGVHVMKLISDLLDLSRIETGRLDLDLGAIDVNKIVAECVAERQADANRRRVIVRSSLAPRLPMVMADEPSARQIIANILSNAVKFNEPGGQVIVSSAVNEKGIVTVRLRDTGIGMTDAEIATALEPFRQLAPSRSPGGTGLGLPLTRALAIANGAALSIRSQPGEGTMVEVTFQPSVMPAARVPA